MEASPRVHRGELAVVEAAGPTNEQADLAIQYIFHDVADIYMKFRGAEGSGTERAILCEPEHVPRRENDAEHTWNLENTIQMLWYNRRSLGLVFPPGFSIADAVRFAHVHDIVEIHAPDVDTLSHNEQNVALKALRERASAAIIDRTRHNRWMSDIWKKYEKQDTPEAQFVSDIDKIVGTVMIAVDGGRRWHNWEGNSANLEYMTGTQRGKLRTANGHALFGALERELLRHPEWFPDAMWVKSELFKVD